jgi:uncharacterized protein YutE (UPF0331/DUF86 family)
VWQVNDVIINKIATIERCLERIYFVYAEVGDDLSTDLTRQDSIVLNLQRACEASIYLANYINKQKKLGTPQSSSVAFDLLFKAGFLPENVTINLKNGGVEKCYCA